MINLILLSDWHINDQKLRNVNVTNLLKSIKNELEINYPNVLVFTGDISQSASKIEFSYFAETVETLKDYCEKNDVEFHFVLCPGNHDVDLSNNFQTFLL